MSICIKMRPSSSKGRVSKVISGVDIMPIVVQRAGAREIVVIKREVFQVRTLVREAVDNR
jgi:hypothetical protein